MNEFRKRKIIKIDNATTEAIRFIAKAKAWRARLGDQYVPFNTKQGGACKRASMDLTRALSDLRRS